MITGTLQKSRWILIAWTAQKSEIRFSVKHILKWVYWIEEKSVGEKRTEEKSSSLSDTKYKFLSHFQRKKKSGIYTY